MTNLKLPVKKDISDEAKCKLKKEKIEDVLQELFFSKLKAIIIVFLRLAYLLPNSSDHISTMHNNAVDVKKCQDQKRSSDITLPSERPLN